MDMRYALSHFMAVFLQDKIGGCAENFPYGLIHFFDGLKDLSAFRIGKQFKALQMSFGNDQAMAGQHGLMRIEGHYKIVFVKFLVVDNGACAKWAGFIWKGACRMHGMARLD